jgi:hypothetical protein
MTIVEDKLGPARAGAVASSLAAAGGGPDDPGRILALLGKRERELVTTEYENRRLGWEAQVGNKCPHVRLAYRLRAATSARESTDLLKKLSAYYRAPQGGRGARTPRPRRARGPKPRPPPELEWILCKNCGFRVVCPHVDELIRMEARNLPYDTVRARLMRFAVQYSGRAGGGAATSYSYFCRICSERLAEFTGEDRTAEVLGAVGNLDDHVKKVIWVEAVNAAELVRFPMPVDPRRFASTAVGVCHPLLLRAEASLLKRGRRATTKPRAEPLTADDPYGDEETVDARTRLYIALFVYAYVLNLIRSSHEASKEASRRLGFEGVRIGARMSAYAQAILSAVLKKYAGLISRIEDVTPEFIAERFREAYRLVAGAGGPQELTSVDEAKLVVNEVVALSPTYHYIAIAARVFGSLPVARPLTPAEAKREFETVLGRTLPAILADRLADSKSELVQMLLGVRPTGRGARRVAVEYPRGADPLYVHSDPEVNFLAKMHRVPDAFVETVDMEPFNRLAALAAAIPACTEHCVIEAAGGRERPKRAKNRAKTRAAKGAKTRAAKGAKTRAKKTRPAVIPFDASAFLRNDPALAAAGSGLYLESYRLFTEYTVDVTDAKSMRAYQGRLAKARARERGYLLFRAATAVKNHRQYGFTVSRRFGLYSDPRPELGRKTRVGDPGAAPEVPLTYLYDEEGLRHSWAGLSNRANLYVYQNIGSPGVAELSLSQLVETIAADYEMGVREGPIHGRTLVDVRCSVCKVLLSEIGTLDAGKARASLRALSEFATFFSFYGSRCPVGGLHDFGGSARACSKCGMAKALVFGYNAPEHSAAARAYYDEHLERYREQRGVVSAVTPSLLGAAAESPVRRQKQDLFDSAAEALEKYRDFVEKWKYNYTLLVRAAELAEAPVAALETLGATGGREYADVLSGADAPPPPVSADDPRLLAADSDVRMFVTAYNRLRFVHRFSKPPPDAEAALEEAQVPKHEYGGLPERLPDVYDDYHLKRLAFLQLRAPEEVLLFTIESLARMVLAVASAGASTSAGARAEPPWVGRLGRGFARAMLEEIIRSERLLAKNGPFNFKIFGDDDVVAGSLGWDDGPADDFGAAGEDVLDAIEAGGGEDGAVDAFSLEAVDIDDETARANLEG